MLALAERLGASALATGHYARVVDDGAGPLLAAPADAAKDQTYMLSGVRAGVAGRASLPTREPDKAPGARAGRRSRPAGRREAREPGPLLPRRRGQARLPRPPRRPARAPGRDRRRTRAAVVGRHRGHHNFTVGQRRGLGRGRGRAALRARRPTRPPTASWSGRAPRWPPSGSGPRRDAASRRRTRRPGQAALSRPPHRAARSRAPPGATSELCVELSEPAYGVAPGQTACLMDGELVVGHVAICRLDCAMS